MALTTFLTLSPSTSSLRPTNESEYVFSSRDTQVTVQGVSFFESSEDKFPQDLVKTWHKKTFFPVKDVRTVRQCQETATIYINTRELDSVVCVPTQKYFSDPLASSYKTKLEISLPGQENPLTILQTGSTNEANERIQIIFEENYPYILFQNPNQTTIVRTASIQSLTVKECNPK